MSGHTDNAVVIDAPIDDVWRITNLIEDWPKMFTEYASTEVLGDRDSGGFLFRLTTHPDRLGRVWQWVSERIPDDDTKTVRSRRTELGPFKYMNLYWEFLEESDGGTRMRWVQDFETRPDAPVGDEELTAHLNSTTCIQQRHIKEYIEQSVVRTG